MGIVGDIILALVCLVIGAVIGGLTAAKVTKAKTGSVSKKAVVAGATIGGTVGGLVGWGVGSAITAATAGTTASSTAKAASVKMQQVAAKGKAGEAAANIVKNTKRIPSATGTASYRIPDGLTTTVLSEVKNYSGKLSYTNQLKDFVSYAMENKLEIHLYTNAKLSGPLQQLVDSGVIQVFPLK